MNIITGMVERAEFQTLLDDDLVWFHLIAWLISSGKMVQS
jgi:hypothetical protein